MDENKILTAAEVQKKEFTLTKLLQGYETNDVDDLLDSIIEALDSYENILSDFEKTRNSMSDDNFNKVMEFLDSIRTRVVSSTSIITAVFPVTKFRTGYDMDEVDVFLDECVETLRMYESRSNAEYLTKILNSRGK